MAVEPLSGKAPTKEDIRRRDALWCEKYHLVFGNETGKEVLEHMKQRAFVYKSTFVGGAPQHVREYREGQRALMLETEDFIRKHIIGFYRQPLQAEATTEEAEN